MESENPETSERIAALFAAIQQGNVDEVEKTLKTLDVDLDDEDLFLDKQQFTPLGAAINHGDLAITKVLLKNGASPKVRKGQYYILPGMHYAATNKNTEMMEMLLEFGAGVDDTCCSALTALMLAIRNGDMEIMRYLLDKGANIDHVSSYEVMPLGLRMHFDYSTTEFYERRAPPWRFNTPLTEACCYRRIDIVKELLARGVDVDKMSMPGKTALMVAAYWETPERYFRDTDRMQFLISPTCPPILRLLIEHGADVYVQNAFEETAVQLILHHIYVIFKYAETCEYVVKTLRYYYINFSLLVKAGCPVSDSYEMDLDTLPHIEDKQVVKTLQVLSQGYSAHASDCNQQDGNLLRETYVGAMTAAVLAGVRPTQDDVIFVDILLQESRTKDQVLNLLRDTSSTGYTLRQICQQKLRQLIKRPLLPTVTSEGFKYPQMLKRCILLDRDVPTDDWCDNFDPSYPGYK